MSSVEKEEGIVEEKDLDQIFADSHDNILPTKKLIIVFAGLALSLFLAFVDQTGITIALPYIANDLDASETISWAGTSSLISNTVFMVLFGRFSDIFSRKYVLIASMLILAFFDLACGFSQTSSQLYVFRAFSGIGVGGITSLSMVIVSDIVTLENRGKYQGILGACVGLGNAIGPFLASAFITHLSWRKFYYMLCPVIVSASVIVYLLVPYTRHEMNVKSKLLQIDYLGLFFSAIGIIFILIPLSGGGTTYQWNSAFCISFFIIGGVAFIIFPIIEIKVAKLPMIPMHLFKTKLSLTALLSQNFFFGMCYYGQIYFSPFFFESIRGYSVITASTYMLSLVLPQVTASIISGQVISRWKHYLPIVWFGYTSWTLGTCLLILWNTSSNKGSTVIPLVFVGMGVGCTFQPTLVAAQAQSYRKDRAIVISTRNVLRSLGGAVGLAIANTILSNTYVKGLSSNELVSANFTADQITYLKTQIFSADLLSQFNSEQVHILRTLYMSGLRNIIYFWIGSICYCLFSTISVRDNGLDHIDNGTTTNSTDS